MTVDKRIDEMFTSKYTINGISQSIIRLALI